MARASVFTFPAAPKDADEAHQIAGSRSCRACHASTDSDNMHAAADRDKITLSCVDCHGGHAEVDVPASIVSAGATSPDYVKVRDRGHVQPKHPELWKSAANPNASGAADA